MKIFLAIILMIGGHSVVAQNLVNNSGFETNSALPATVGQWADAIGWSNCNGAGSPDYFHVNGSGIVQLPNTFIGTVYPHGGDAVMGFCPYYNSQSVDYREYVSTTLTNVLVPGNVYDVSFYETSGINAGSYCGQGIDQLSVVLSVGALTQSGTTPITSVTPQWTTPVILYDTGWVQISFQFTAADAYDHITFGNFVNDAGTNAQTFAITSFPGAYYFIDDIDVHEDSVPQVNLNFAATDTTLCEKFCISFFDSSANNPTAWEWIFPGGSPSTSTLQNPANICYDVPGTYNVTLITTSANGIDTLTLTNYITVYATPPFPTITQAGYTLTSSSATSYQWQLNSSDIPGATDQSYTVTQSGYYTVLVSDSNGCVNSASIKVIISGIEEVGDGSFSIYPNPASDVLTVEFLNSMFDDAITISLVNAIGQEIFSSEESSSSSGRKKEIDLRDISSGIYFIEIKSENIFLKRKIIITK